MLTVSGSRFRGVLAGFRSWKVCGLPKSCRKFEEKLVPCTASFPLINAAYPVSDSCSKEAVSNQQLYIHRLYWRSDAELISPLAGNNFPPVDVETFNKQEPQQAATISRLTPVIACCSTRRTGRSRDRFGSNEAARLAI